MAFDRAFPIWTATLRRPGGPSLTVPLTLPAPVGIGESPQTVAQRIADEIRDHWMVTGEYDPLVAGRLTEVTPLSITVDLPKIDAVRPAQTVPFVAVAAPTGAGVTVWVPPLDLVVWGEDEAAATAAARGAIGAWIARYDIRDEVGALAAASGWTDIEATVVTEVLTWYSLSERREMAARRGAARTPYLDSATAPLPRDTCFGLDLPKAALRRALSAGGSVVLVGPRGAGKTCLAADVAVAELGERLRTTTAARLEVALTGSGAWQGPLGQLCAELHRRSVRLHVAALADLFEVGRYVGNSVSLGEYLRPWLARRDVVLLAECTAEEFARVEARYPGVLEHFTRIDVPAPDDAALASVVSAWASAGHAPRATPDAVTEIVRLQRRFAPYAGFPGVTLRFLAGLARAARPVTREAVAAQFSADSGLPRVFVDPRAALSVDTLRERLASALFGQPEAIDALLDVLTAIKADVSPRGRPIASMLFTGPTGVGKTEAARALATVLFGHKDRMVRFDCSELATPGAVARLVSSHAPHGEGLLTGAARRQPFSVVLFDEIEKAHPDLFDLLLQVLGEGRLTDHRGRTADFCSAVVVLTSNLGAERAQRPRIGVGVDTAKDLAEELRAAVYRAFRPELVNRFDRILPFRPLPREAVLRVLDRELAALARHPALVDRSARLTVSDESRDWLVEHGHEPSRGARPLQRLLREAVVSPVAAAIDARGGQHGVAYEVSLVGGRPVVRTRESGDPVDRRPSEADQFSAWRRVLDGVLAGDTMAELNTALATRQRQAQLAAADRPVRAAPELMATIRELRSAVRAVRDWHAEITRREAEALATELGASGAAPVRWDPDEVHARTLAVCRAVYDAVHPSHRLAFIGLWSPSANLDPVPLVDARANALAEAAEQAGFTVHQRVLWDEGRATIAASRSLVVTTARRWLGVELWLEGSAALRWAWPAHGLFEHHKTRVRIEVTAPQPRAVPDCCESAPESTPPLRLAGATPPSARAETPERWVPLRPGDLLRMSAYEGNAMPVPLSVPTDRDLLTELLAHLGEAV